MLALKVLHHMAALSLMHIGMAEQQLAVLETRSLQRVQEPVTVWCCWLFADNPHLLSQALKVTKGE